jgi:hypothetical protein
MPFLPALTLLFIGLKLTNYITWSWWLVLSPIWVLVLSTIGLFAIAGIIDYINYRRRLTNKK